MNSENGQLTPAILQNANPQHQPNSEHGDPEKRPSILQKLRRKSTIQNNNIKINFGNGATQDPAYNFQDNTVRTTK